MINATIHNLEFFENFLAVINKFVQQCQFVLTKKGVNVYCKNPTGFASCRLLLESNVISLDFDEKVDEISVCIRDVIAFKSAISIVKQVQDLDEITISLEDVKDRNDDIVIKSIKYNNKHGGSFNLVTIDFDIIKDFVSKDLSVDLKGDWTFNINPKNLDIAQNKTNNIINFGDVGVYIFKNEEDGKAIIELSSKTSSAVNSISLPLSDKSEGGFVEDCNYDKVAIHESSFRILNILRATDENNLVCMFNCANNAFYIKSAIKQDDVYIKSRMLISIIKGK